MWHNVAMNNFLHQIFRPFEEFFKHQVAGGLVLLAVTALAMLLANSPWRDVYFAVWELQLTIGIEPLALSKSLSHWINDGLMAVFFFVVGLEIKREFLAGELTGARKAALPIAAAVGGMVVPALLFMLIGPQGVEARGWAIPMATDIAFALGIIALLGNRIPRALAIFLTALAIVDDLGAVLVIAIFYTGELSLSALAAGAACFAALASGNRLGIKSPNFYALIGLLLWIALLKSGIHATVAGVLIGMTIPVRPRYGHDEFLAKAEQLFTGYRSLGASAGPFMQEEKLGTLLALEHACHDALSPLQRMEHEMHHWVILGVMPIFALANAGITLDIGQLGTAFTHPVTLGIAIGLLVGKPLGITLCAWVAVRLGIAILPPGISWGQIFGVGLLGGIGFTMSLFITNLAYGANQELIAAAKVGIFAASLLAGTLGYLLLRRLAQAPR
jgi:NhaA family Na+:H+ antiporter